MVGSCRSVTSHHSLFGVKLLTLEGAASRSPFGSRPGVDERQLYGSPPRPTGSRQRGPGIGWPDPTLSCPSSYPEAAGRPSPVATRSATRKQTLVVSGSRLTPDFGFRRARTPERSVSPVGSLRSIGRHCPGPSSIFLPAVRRVCPDTPVRCRSSVPSRHRSRSNSDVGLQTRAVDLIRTLSRGQSSWLLLSFRWAAHREGR